MATISIVNGQVYDPANNEDGVLRPVHIQGGKITGTASVADKGCQTLDATGCVVMAGGVDIHTHVAGPMARLARGAVPTLAETGRLYSQMGYTTIIEPAVHPSMALAAHSDAGDIPIVDKGLLVLLSPQGPVIEFIEKKDHKAVREHIAWLVNGTKAYSVKLVNPGGKYMDDRDGGYSGIDTQLTGFNITPKEIMIAVSDAVGELGLPHPVHIHLCDLGSPQGCDTAISAIGALDGRQAHITHIQFNSYGGRDGGRGLLSRSGKLADVINLNPNITVDIGQVVFEPTMTVTADIAVLRKLSAVTGIMWEPLLVGCGDLCGTAPYEYTRKSFVNCVQWATGLELFLLIDDPWQVYLSTDHPNAGPFTAYPEIIKLLMNKDYRDEELATLHPDTVNATSLKNIDREYSLYEIAVITRAGPARRLGLANKGHLGKGADADVAIYRMDDDFEAMFAKPVWVIKDGKIVVKDGEVTDSFDGKTYFSPVSSSFPDSVGGAQSLMGKYCPDGLSDFPVNPESLPWLEQAPGKEDNLY